ncbi:hypothetical protein IFM89_019013 [Coptis chinensis]|uniref:Uncharacterized protein n=1 Tax=Coptis chinensis TaxID=261450 RepID=A0A835HZP3_9MAGN|nr:hypothetical protein IFM89_019013 [Coptis chinensis]
MAEDGGRELRGEDLMHPLKVSLEELYNGTSKKLSLSQNVICFKCKGKAKEAETSRTTEAEALIQQVKQEVEKTNAAETETTEVEAMIIQLKQELEAAKAAETKIAEAKTFVKKLKELEFVRGICIYSNSSTVSSVRELN